ncbi:gamma-aminobutyric acid receptor subunit pi-like [Saccostrea echinata]|uniref:gamma-aminobutyric acid receptor subunit pi-like n=1 Tax=Saccostrea echinata TaxID=191078 RepID=UPI002A814B6D|nr:gamma-aminobutyric acid receptor subunit pi-like [Saccostrea echinata]
MRSDNGTNFVGAEREIKSAINEWNVSQIEDSMLQRNIEWKFNPPAGSHYGGGCGISTPCFILLTHCILCCLCQGILPPWEVSGNETTVFISLFVTQFRSLILDADMTFDIRQSWKDQRFVNASRNPNDYILYKAEEFENLWRPDTYIANEMPNGLFETSLTDNIYAYPNGSLYLTTRHSIVFHCDVKLFALPIKDETCSLYFKSASYSSENLKFLWKLVTPVTYSKTMKTYAVTIKRTETKLCSQGESMPCLHLILYVQRKYQTMFVQVYLPSTCIVFITWLGFWIHHTEVSGRTRISTISLTAIIADSVGTLIMNPDQVHMAAVEAWNAGCFIIITLAFLEFVIVHNYHRRQMNKKNSTEDEGIQGKLETQNSIQNNSKVTSINKRKKISKSKVAPEVIHVIDIPINAEDTKEKKSGLAPETIDRISCLLYALLFILFNIYYWAFFLTEADKK